MTQALVVNINTVSTQYATIQTCILPFSIFDVITLFIHFFETFYRSNCMSQATCKGTNFAVEAHYVLSSYGCSIANVNHETSLTMANTICAIITQCKPASAYYYTVFTALYGMQPRFSDEKSVCLSIKRVNCDKTEKRSVQIFIPYERSFSLVF